MSLKITVKVSEINNLSDARYCAGMGVDMIGFSLDENHPKFIEISKVMEISNWISGIKVVGEFTGNNVQNINYLSEQLNLDYVQLDHKNFNIDLLTDIKKSIILKVEPVISSKEEIQELPETVKNKIEYLLFQIDELTLENLQMIKNIKGDLPIILSAPFNLQELDLIINELKPEGINLIGGSEIKPGLKDFTELSEILEYLEESN